VDVLERLHKLMDARGWTMYRLAKESGLTESTIANIYRRNAIPSIDTLEKICHGFGITLSQFFADAELVELTEDLKEVFENWRIAAIDSNLYAWRHSSEWRFFYTH